MNDPIGDMITRIRNGQMVYKDTVNCPASKLRVAVLDVLKREGYITSYSNKEVRPGVAELIIELKYYEDKPVIQEIKKISKPGRRVYSSISDLKKVYNGLGISILSTPRGVMSDQEARDNHVGGEVICTVF